MNNLSTQVCMCSGLLGILVLLRICIVIYKVIGTQ